MSQKRLLSPKLDERTWQDFVDQVRALIPVYAPEWSDHGPDDLGTTLIELFAWLAEGQAYRLNRAPEKNYIEFLNLLGITRDPATPASTYLTYRLAPGSASITLPRGSLAATPQTETEEAIVFETNDDVRIYPLRLMTVLGCQKPHFVLGEPGDYRSGDLTAQLVNDSTSQLSLGVIFGFKIQILIGFDAATTDEFTMMCNVNEPLHIEPPGISRALITWQYSKGTNEPEAWEPLAILSDHTEGLRKSGKTTLSVPNDWACQKPEDWTSFMYHWHDHPSEVTEQTRFWIGVTILHAHITDTFDYESDPFPDPAPVIRLKFALSPFNIVPATNALTVSKPELLGTSEGRPFQQFELQHCPLFKQTGVPDPYGHLVIEVREPLVGGPDEFGGWEAWARVETFSAGGGREYRLDPVTGTVYLGDYEEERETGRGRVPPLNSQIRALTYRYVAGGENGNVSPGAVSVVRSAPPEVQSVANPGPATGGSVEEPVEETKRRGPELLRNRYRAVSVEDAEYLAREATTDVKKVRCLPPRLFTYAEADAEGRSAGTPWTYADINRGPNYINVIIVSDAPPTQAKPMPSDELLQEVTEYLDRRRAVTSILNVTGPRYLPLKITVTGQLWPAVEDGLVSEEMLEAEVAAKISAFLHPLTGGPEGNGWDIGQDFSIAGLLEFIQPAPEIGFVTGVTVAIEDPGDRPSFLELEPSAYIQAADYELICSAGAHEVDFE